MSEAIVPITLSDVYQHLDNKKALLCAQKVTSHNWETLYRSLRKKRPTAHPPYLRQELIEYLRFLIIKLETNDIKLKEEPSEKPPRLNLAVSKGIDDKWHQHMLLPQDYYKFSLLVGTLIEHDPDTTNSTDWNERYKRTYDEYRRIFKQEPSSCSWSVPCIANFPCDFCIECREKQNHKKEKINQIFVMGLSGKTMSVEMDLKNDTVIDIMLILSKIEGINCCDQSLTYAGNRLFGSDKTLSGYNIQKESTLHLSGKLRGC